MGYDIASTIVGIYQRLWEEYPTVSGDLLLELVSRTVSNKSILYNCGPLDIAMAMIISKAKHER